MISSQNYQPSQSRQDSRMLRLKQDNVQLQKALKQLNECYQQKISLLQEELKKSKQRQQVLLQWKSSYIDKQLFNNAKYQQQLEKMIQMMQEMSQNYEKQNQTYKTQLQQKQDEITHLKNENNYLRQEKDNQEEKIQSLAQKYIVEIERLNTQLKDLKEEINYDEIQDNAFSVHQNTDNWQSEENNQNNTSQQSIFDEAANQNTEKQSQNQEQGVLKDISNNYQQMNSSLHQGNQKSSRPQMMTQLKGQLIC